MLINDAANQRSRSLALNLKRLIDLQREAVFVSLICFCLLLARKKCADYFVPHDWNIILLNCGRIFVSVMENFGIKHTDSFICFVSPFELNFLESRGLNDFLKMMFTVTTNVYICFPVAWLFTEYEVALGILSFQCKTWEFRATSYSVNSQTIIQGICITLSRGKSSKVMKIFLDIYKNVSFSARLVSHFGMYRRYKFLEVV